MKKSSLFILIPFFFILACGQKSHEHEGHDAAAVPGEASANHMLYEKVEKVHNEAMAKLDEVYTLKEGLKDKIAKTPAMDAAKKTEIEHTIAKLDSAHENMMTFMHGFQEPADSVNEDKAREYLDGQMEKAQKVKTDILEAIEKAKAQ